MRVGTGSGDVGRKGMVEEVRKVAPSRRVLAMKLHNSFVLGYRREREHSFPMEAIKPCRRHVSVVYMRLMEAKHFLRPTAAVRVNWE